MRERHRFQHRGRCLLADHRGGRHERASLQLALDDRCSALNDLGHFDLALRDCNGAIALDPGFARSYNNRANAFAGLQRYEEALSDYDEAIRRDPGFEFAFYNRGLAWQALGDYEHALADYTAAILLAPRDVLNILRAAISMPSAAMRRMPLPIATSHWRSILPTRRRPWPGAPMPICAPAISTAPSPITTRPSISIPALPVRFYGRGVAYARKGRQAEAEKDISTARILDPNIDREMAAIHIAAPAGI